MNKSYELYSNAEDKLPVSRSVNSSPVSQQSFINCPLRKSSLQLNPSYYNQAIVSVTILLYSSREICKYFMQRVIV